MTDETEIEPAFDGNTELDDATPVEDDDASPKNDSVPPGEDT